MSTPTILQTNSEKKASSLLEQISRAAPISVQFSRSVVSDSLWPHGLQHTRLPCPSPTPRAYSNSCPLRRWCLQPSHPLSSPSPLAFKLSQHQGLFKWVSTSHKVAKVLEFQLQHLSFQWIFRTGMPYCILMTKGLFSTRNAACLLIIQWDYWNFLPRVGENN